ncbi:MAG: DUF2061 domain-containing protein [Candidatus Omnitrophica bacterium]|nr:DUF2061 domain-containing protein [Candidatus Omnitrophota bacterium]
METRARSFAKALSWRFLATFITAFIVWGLTGEAKFGLTVGLIDTSVKLFIYFIHERVWLRISFGKKKQDFEI